MFPIHITILVNITSSFGLGNNEGFGWKMWQVILWMCQITHWYAKFKWVLAHCRDPTCPTINIRVWCGNFQQRWPNPRIFIVLGYDDCLVYGGWPLSLMRVCLLHMPTPSSPWHSSIQTYCVNSLHACHCYLVLIFPLFMSCCLNEPYINLRKVDSRETRICPTVIRTHNG